MLRAQIGEYGMCLKCSKQFRTAEACRRHMLSTGHTQVDYEEEGQLELEEFYDYRTSYPEYRARLAGTEGDGEDDSEGEWESVDEEEEGGEAGTVVHIDERVEHGAEDFAMMARHAATRGPTLDGAELVLPSGRRLGHRDFLRYYKQRLDPRFSGPEYREAKAQGKILARARAAIGLPGYGSGAPTKDAKRARDRAQHDMKYARMRQGVKNNKSYMNRFFREQLLQ